MTSRLAKLKVMLNKIPSEKRTLQNKKFKRLSIEFRLLQWKKILYETKDPCMGLVRWRVELTDRHSFEPAESMESCLEHKKEQILPLLNLDLSRQSEEALHALLKKIEEEDVATQ